MSKFGKSHAAPRKPASTLPHKLIDTLSPQGKRASDTGSKDTSTKPANGTLSESGPRTSESDKRIGRMGSGSIKPSLAARK